MIVLSRVGFVGCHRWTVAIAARSESTAVQLASYTSCRRQITNHCSCKLCKSALVLVNILQDKLISAWQV